MSTLWEQHCKKAVSGYIRNTTKNMTFINDMLIPIEIITEIFKFYFEEMDIFNKHDPDIFDISNEKKTATRKKNSKPYIWGTVYGNQWIQSTLKQIVKWKIKVVKLNVENSCFGVSIIDDKQTGNYCHDKDNACYGLWGCSGGTMIKHRWKSGYGTGVHPGDVVEIILNLIDHTISYCVNDKSLGIAFKEIPIGDNIKYILAVALLNDGSEISLQDFKIERK